jgi:hypothetical protein
VTKFALEYRCGAAPESNRVPFSAGGECPRHQHGGDHRVPFERESRDTRPSRASLSVAATSVGVRSPRRAGRPRAQGTRRRALGTGFHRPSLASRRSPAHSRAGNRETDIARRGRGWGIGALRAARRRERTADGRGREHPCGGPLEKPSNRPLAPSGGWIGDRGRVGTGTGAIRDKSRHIVASELKNLSRETARAAHARLRVSPV